MSDRHFANKPLNLPFEVGLELRGYTLLCYRVRAACLRPLVPSRYPLLTWEANGQAYTWMSVFIGQNVLQRLGPVPAPPMSFYQLNYRAYIQAPERSLYIFRSVVDSPLVAAGSRMALDFPAVYEPFRVEGATRMSVGVEGRELALELASAPLAAVPGFTPEEAVRFFGDVPDAYYGRAGKQRRMASPHPPLAPAGARVLRADLGWLMRKDVLTRAEAQEPVAVYLQPSAEFPVCF